jgi:predicted ATPase
MPLTAVSIKNFRSIKAIRLPVGPLTVLVGKNAVGKTNLYRALHLLQAAALGTITREIAEDGGMYSVCWAGPQSQKDPIRISLSAEFGEHGYGIDVGYPNKVSEAALEFEPRVKEETITIQTSRRRINLLERRGPSAWIRDVNGKVHDFEMALLASETALATIRDVAQFPLVDAIRQELADWRFYHDFRTDAGSFLRQPCHALSTPTLSSTGDNLAAVFETLRVVRQDTVDLDAAVEDAFPGAKLVSTTENNRASFSMRFKDMWRPFAQHELSDGTLRYLGILGALMGYRLPKFVALNEPEASLHPDLIPPLARLIVKATDRTRIWLVTHSEKLSSEIERLSGVPARTVEKRKDGSTWISGLSLIGDFRDGDDEDQD